MSGGSRMWQSASTTSYLDMRYRPLLTFVSVYSEGIQVAQRLLAGLQVVDLGAEPSARAARVMGDLGATVVRVVPPAGDVLRGNVARAWNAGKQVTALAGDDPALDELLASAEVVFDSPGTGGTHELDAGRAPNAVWVSITPFG